MDKTGQVSVAQVFEVNNSNGGGNIFPPPTFHHGPYGLPPISSCPYSRSQKRVGSNMKEVIKDAVADEISKQIKSTLGNQSKIPFYDFQSSIPSPVRRIIHEPSTKKKSDG